MKHIPQYLQDALDTEVANAIAKQQETDFAMFENIVMDLRTYRVNRKLPTRKQCVELVANGFNHLKQKHLKSQTPKRVILARMEGV